MILQFLHFTASLKGNTRTHKCSIKFIFRTESMRSKTLLSVATILVQKNSQTSERLSTTFFQTHSHNILRHHIFFMNFQQPVATLTDVTDSIPLAVVIAEWDSDLLALWDVLSGTDVESNCILLKHVLNLCTISATLKHTFHLCNICATSHQG